MEKISGNFPTRTRDLESEERENFGDWEGGQTRGDKTRRAQTMKSEVRVLVWSDDKRSFETVRQKILNSDRLAGPMVAESSRWFYQDELAGVSYREVPPETLAGSEVRVGWFEALTEDVFEMDDEKSRFLEGAAQGVALNSGSSTCLTGCLPDKRKSVQVLMVALPMRRFLAISKRGEGSRWSRRIGHKLFGRRWAVRESIDSDSVASLGALSLKLGEVADRCKATRRTPWVVVTDCDRHSPELLRDLQAELLRFRARHPLRHRLWDARIVYDSDAPEDLRFFAKLGTDLSYAGVSRSESLLEEQLFRSRVLSLADLETP